MNNVDIRCSVLKVYIIIQKCIFMYLMECFFFAFIFYNMLFVIEIGTFSINFFLGKKKLWKKF